MELQEKKKRLAWRLARAAFVSGGVFGSEMQQPSQGAVSIGIMIADALANYGCLDDKYGDEGSYEVDCAVKAFAANGFFDYCYRCGNGNQIVLDIFAKVRVQLEAGIDRDEIKRMRTVEYDREQAEIKRRQEEDAERLRKKREAEAEAAVREREERISKLESEIEASKGGL